MEPVSDSVSLDLPTNFVISVSDERQIASTPEIYRIRTSTLIPLQTFDNSSGHNRSGRGNFNRRLSILNVARKENLGKPKKVHKMRNGTQNQKDNASFQLASHSKR